ncbi:MAG: hypothetical protein RLZZ455_205 [Candidatus Parcubacteria bacterium]|jgi:probable phosphoglycerate mutase
MLIFARHGETISGSGDRFEGYSDSPLTDRGRSQAELLGNYCRKFKFSSILASPRGRSLATAAIVSKIMNRKFEVNGNLAEICYGSWETMKRDAISGSPLWRKREENFFTFRHPGEYMNTQGESYSDLYERLLPVFSVLEKGVSDVLVIAHSGVLRCARKYFEKINDTEFKESKFLNSTFFLITNEKGKLSTSLYDVVENRQLSR